MSGLPDSQPRVRDLRPFLALAGLLALVQFLADRARVPPNWSPLLSLLAGAVVLGLSVAALFVGSKGGLQGRSALATLLLGATAMALLVWLSRILGGGVGASLAMAMGQACLLVACLGLGSLVAGAIKEPNLLAPMCLFLPFFDAFLVLTQKGFTKKVMEAAPQVLESVAMRVPEVSSGPKQAPLQAVAFIGPADLVFVALFAAILHRFHLNSRGTLLWLAPALVAYLLVVMLAGDTKIGPVALNALPALVPIGLVVLLTNLRHLSLSRQEWVLTALAGLLGAGLLAYGSSFGS
ncbi:MAG: hypothetical protein WHU10_04890 [Fimbriimonadales bacterium]